MEMPLRQLAYTSHASFELSEAELLKILTVSRDCNKRDQVTGFLIYHEQRFFQVIEGPPEAIEALYLRLHQDVRHHNLIKLLDRQISLRMFNLWNMAFKFLNHQDVTDFPMYSDYLLHCLSLADQPAPALVKSASLDDVEELIAALKDRFVA
jgi:hypothetical protein